MNAGVLFTYVVSDLIIASCDILSKKVKVKVHVILRTGVPVRCLSPFDGPCAPLKYVTHGQADATPTVTFPTAERRRPLTSPA